MERRSSSRTLALFPVEIPALGMEPLRCMTRNLSRKGALLETRNVTIPMHSIISVALPFREGVPGLELPALVVHSKPGRTGIWFALEPDGQPVSIIDMVESSGSAGENGADKAYQLAPRRYFSL